MARGKQFESKYKTKSFQAPPKVEAPPSVKPEPRIPFEKPPKTVVARTKTRPDTYLPISSFLGGDYWNRKNWLESPCDTGVLDPVNNTMGSLVANRIRRLESGEVIDPVVVRLVPPDKKAAIQDGWIRVAALARLGKDIPVKIVP